MGTEGTGLLLKFGNVTQTVSLLHCSIGEQDIGPARAVGLRGIFYMKPAAASAHRDPCESLRTGQFFELVKLPHQFPGLRGQLRAWGRAVARIQNPHQFARNLRLGANIAVTEKFLSRLQSQLLFERDVSDPNYLFSQPVIGSQSQIGHHFDGAPALALGGNPFGPAGQLDQILPRIGIKGFFASAILQDETPHHIDRNLRSDGARALLDCRQEHPDDERPGFQSHKRSIFHIFRQLFGLFLYSSSPRRISSYPDSRNT